MWQSLYFSLPIFIFFNFSCTSMNVQCNRWADLCCAVKIRLWNAWVVNFKEQKNSCRIQKWIEPITWVFRPQQIGAVCCFWIKRRGHESRKVSKWRSFSISGVVRSGHRLEVSHVREGHRNGGLAPAQSQDDHPPLCHPQEQRLHQERSKSGRSLRSGQLTFFLAVSNRKFRRDDVLS